MQIYNQVASMKQHHILLAEDEPFLARVVKDSLEREGYVVSHVEDGSKALGLFRNCTFDVCLLDVMLPGISGFELSRQIRSYDSLIPIIFLTAKTATSDVIEGYSAGGNDYLRKPFSLDELFLRVREVLSRTSRSSSEPELRIGKFTFLPGRQELRFDNGELTLLSNRESCLLMMLARNKNQLLDRKAALITLWGDDNFFNARTMDVFISKLRKKFAADPSIQIINVRGYGYKLLVG